MKYTITLCVSIIALFCNAQDQLNGIDLIDHNKFPYLHVNRDYAHIERSKDETNQWQITFKTHTEPKFTYYCSTNLPIIKKQDYKKGTLFLLTFKARTEMASLETGEAKALIMLKQTQDYKGNIEYTQSFSSDWQTYYLPFQLDRFVSGNVMKVVMHYGFRPQSFLMKDIKFEVFPEGTRIESLPKTEITYTGMEPEAEWRKKAKERIEVLRKGDFNVHFLKNGPPIPNRVINIKLIKHGFPFGARMAAEDIVNVTNDYKNFKKAFNSLVLGNDLKIKQWKREVNRKTTLKALKILKEEGYPVKGHVLVWPGFQYLTPEIRLNENNPQKVREIIVDHIENILNETQGMVTHWDVVNEAYTNKDLQNITGGEEILYKAFEILAEKQPRLRRFVNEYGIISKGGIDTQKQQWYYEFVKRIDENTGGLVQGIGIQCHMGSDLTPPERVLEILSYYATLGKQISISEFTMDIQDPEVRERYTRDLMIAAFSHPNVSEFLFWGNTEDGRNKCDIFNSNNEIGVMGKAYFSLVHKDWLTNINVTTSENGLAEGRGFFGTYEYTFVEEGRLVRGTFQVRPRQRDNIKIEI